MPLVSILVESGLNSLGLMSLTGNLLISVEKRKKLRIIQLSTHKLPNSGSETPYSTSIRNKALIIRML
ncbi:unnamed protein product [Caenorhabditis angaria]|uniref:Uncharacterized protein n=1 Tax=Caenorhabditis angaria TaxID=860376 RepID=A0A9P1ILR7_9PELO|nr:unnamed protein product [Caenorhabditis angaria]